MSVSITIFGVPVPYVKMFPQISPQSDETKTKLLNIFIYGNVKKYDKE